MASESTHGHPSSTLMPPEASCTRLWHFRSTSSAVDPKDWAGCVPFLLLYLLLFGICQAQTRSCLQWRDIRWIWVRKIPLQVTTTPVFFAWTVTWTRGRPGGLPAQVCRVRSSDRTATGDYAHAHRCLFGFRLGLDLAHGILLRLFGLFSCARGFSFPDRGGTKFTGGHRVLAIGPPEDSKTFLRQPDARTVLKYGDVSQSV